MVFAHITFTKPDLFQRVDADASADAKWQKLRNIFDLSEHDSIDKNRGDKDVS